MNSVSFRQNFPKELPEISAKKKAIFDEFLEIWHLELANKQRYNLIEIFNHTYGVRSQYYKRLKNHQIRTLEIGTGLGTHIHFEDLGHQEYFANELRENMLDHVKRDHPTVHCIPGDIQEPTGFSDDFFDRINAIHVLEHLPNLPACIDECFRILKPGGLFQVVIPCDPGLLYGFCRSISAKRIFEKKYGIDYDEFITREHINTPNEIMALLREQFSVMQRSFFPFKVPSVHLNLCLGLSLIKQ